MSVKNISILKKEKKKKKRKKKKEKRKRKKTDASVPLIIRTCIYGCNVNITDLLKVFEIFFYSSQAVFYNIY